MCVYIRNSILNISIVTSLGTLSTCTPRSRSSQSAQFGRAHVNFCRAFASFLLRLSLLPSGRNQDRKCSSLSFSFLSLFLFFKDRERGGDKTRLHCSVCPFFKFPFPTKILARDQ